LPAGCQPRDVAGLVTRFVDAFNEGDTKQVLQYFAEGGDAQTNFQWYAVNGRARNGKRPHFVARSRGQLEMYVSGRHRVGQRLHLLVIDVGPSGISSSSGATTFALWARGGALVAERSALLEGKAEINCLSQTIYVWTMGVTDRPVSSTVASICPLPKGWSGNAQTVVACSRRA
jgi:hypothetical protein